MALDLPEYVALSDATLSYWLDVPLDRFAFIGRVGEEADLRRLCAILDLPFRPEHANANPEGSGYDVPQDWRDRYEAANPREVALFREIRDG